jgi:pentatricopeptide repeat protein
MEDFGPMPVKKTYAVLIGGFLKGGNYQEASAAVHQMLDRGLRPDPHVMLAVLRSLQKADLVTHYLHLCNTLAQVGMIEPCLLYFYIDELNLCIIRLL